MFELDDADLKEVIRYSKTLENSILIAASLALNSLTPAELKFGKTKATFAINRRQFVQGSVRLDENPEGIVDHTVPVLTVNSPDGKPQIILFGYACHNTTLGGDFYEVDGDYAGFAQRTLEEKFPGTVAMFLQLCGGDQNPKPRSKYADVEKKWRRTRKLCKKFDTLFKIDFNSSANKNSFRRNTTCVHKSHPQNL